MKMKTTKKKFILKNISKVGKTNYEKYRAKKLKKYFFMNNMYSFMHIRLNIMKKKNYLFFIKHFIMVKYMYKYIYKHFLKSYIYSLSISTDNNIYVDENISKKYLFKNYTKNIFISKNLEISHKNKTSNIIAHKKNNFYFVENCEKILENDKINKEILFNFNTIKYTYEYMYTYNLI